MYKTRGGLWCEGTDKDDTKDLNKVGVTRRSIRSVTVYRRKMTRRERVKSQKHNVKDDRPWGLSVYLVGT